MPIVLLTMFIASCAPAYTTKKEGKPTKKIGQGVKLVGEGTGEIITEAYEWFENRIEDATKYGKKQVVKGARYIINNWDDSTNIRIFRYVPHKNYNPEIKTDSTSKR